MKRREKHAGRKRESGSAIRSRSDYVFEGFCTLIVAAFAVCCLAPFVYVFFTSFMTYEEYLANPLRIIPRDFSLEAYKEILNYNLIHSGALVSFTITIVGTVLSVVLLVITAYPLSRPQLKGRKFLMSMILFTMFFSGGMIPNYLLIRNLGLYDTVWALILPECISAFNLILMKNFIHSSVPESLIEAAKMDGASDLRVLWSIVVPMIKPAIATMTIFHAVGYWNNYFAASMYVSDRKLWPLTLVLRELVVENTDAVSPVTAMLTSQARSHPFTLKMAAIVIVITPILVVYPFMQRYFVKGVSLGSIKE